MSSEDMPGAVPYEFVYPLNGSVVTEPVSGEDWITDQDMFGEKYMSDGMPASFDPFGLPKDSLNEDPYTSLDESKVERWIVLEPVTFSDDIDTDEGWQRMFSQTWPGHVDEQSEPGGLDDNGHDEMGDVGELYDEKGEA